MHRVSRLSTLTSTLLGIALVSFVAVGCGSNSGSDVNAVFSKYACSGTGCHDATTKAANFDMASPGLETRLVGVMSPGGGPTGLTSMCAGMFYLNGGSNPATGLFISKLSPNPPCGLQMPMVGMKLTTADMMTIQDWANGLTAGH
jgi:hypothetical protein